MNGRPVLRWSVFGLCALWFVFTLFPLYWAGVTSIKTAKGVNAGATYVPGFDFEPTMKPILDMLSGERGDFVTTFLNSTIISISATALAMLLGSMAAYALVRFQFRVRLLSGVTFAVVGVGVYLIAEALLDLKAVAAMGLAFGTALATSILVNRWKLPGPVLSNKDVVFWFISQRMMPPIVSAFALYLLYSMIGREGFKLIDTFLGLLLCYTAFALPIVVWLMRDFIAALPIEVEEAALVDDVPRFRIFFEIVLPMARPGLVAVSLITLGFIWNEFLFALILTTGDWQTLPILLSGQNSFRGDEWWAIAVAAIVAIIPMVFITVILARMMRFGLTFGSLK